MVLNFKKIFILVFTVILLLGSLADFVSIGYAENTTDQEKKTDDVTVLQEKSDIKSLGLAPNEVVVANGKKGSDLLDFEAFIKPSDIVDGTEPFDKSNEAGNDSSPNNGIVRTFDTVTYPLKVTINPKKHDKLKDIKLKITGTLENGITNKRVNAKFAVGGKEDLEKGIVSFDMEYTLKETGNSLMIPVTVEVQGAEHGIKLKPNIKIQVMSVEGKDILNEQIEQSFENISPVTTSGKVNVKARINQSYSTLNFRLYRAYNPNAAESNRSNVFGNTITFYIANLPYRNDLRGATFPNGKINYHFEFSGRVTWDDKSLAETVLDFESEDTPIKIFNYGDIDTEAKKIPQENTESFELGIENYMQVNPHVAFTARSYIPKDKWNADDIEKYTINSVWDSGKTEISKPEVGKEKVVYKASVKDYVIGSTFPTMHAHTTNVPSFSKNQKAFSTVAFLIHTPNEYRSLGKNNQINKPNNVYYDLKCIVDSYEDSKGNVISYNTSTSTTITERNTVNGSYSLQNAFFTPDGKELGTPNLGYSTVSKGDATTIVGQDVKMHADLNVHAVTEGGAIIVYKWNTDSFYLTKEAGERAARDIISRGYTSLLGTTISDSDKQKVYYGIARKNDNSFQAITQNKEEDYEWYTTYDEARKYGEIAAIKNDIQDMFSHGTIIERGIFFKVKTREVGSVNEKGTPNIIATAADIFPTADRKTRYRVAENRAYNNYTEYDENGVMTKLQSPVKSSVNFETLGIMNGETSSEVTTNKTTYYSSDNVNVTVDNLVKLPGEMDFTYLDEKIEMRVKIPKGLDYVVGTAKYGDQYIEPKIEQQSDGSNHLIWYDTLTRSNKVLKKINFETRINPVLLPQGNQVGLEIQNVLSSSMDTRLEKFRTSSKNISIVKIGMVGVSETIKKLQVKKIVIMKLGCSHIQL